VERRRRECRGAKKVWGGVGKWGGNTVATDRPCCDGCGIATAFVVEETGASWVVLKVTVAIRGRPTAYEEPSCSDR